MSKNFESKNFLKVGTKKDVNKLVEQALIVFPEAVLEDNKSAGCLKLIFEGEDLISALKMSGGWSILLPRKFWSDGSVIQNAEHLEKCLEES